MTYRLKTGDADVASGLRRVASDQVEKAVAQMQAAEGAGIHEAVHEARKRVKKLRGLLRLVRGAMADYDAENGYLRDSARLVSGLRDRAAILESFDRVAAAAGEVDGRRIAPLRRALVEERDAALRAPDVADRLVAFRTALETVRAAIPGWSLDGDGWDAVAPGLTKTYGRARKAMGAALDDPGMETMHAWRKRVKYHWYHARLLRDIWPEAMEPHVDAADRLSDVLGDRHDLDVLEPRVAASDLPEKVRSGLRAAMAAERARLDAEAAPLGRRLLADKPKALGRRWGAWWRTAQA